MASGKPTQDFIPIKEVRDGVAILKEGGLRAVLLATSINLSLKSSDEQVAILMQFQNFLNSIDFSIQILIQSRRRDMRPYLVSLEEHERAQLEPLLKIQTKEYIQFIKQFSDENNVMEKNFFVVVPYTPVTLNTSKGIGGMLPSFGKKGQTDTQIKDEQFEEARSQLDQRVAVVSQGLSRMGVRTAMLGTEEVVELFYKIFNPGEAASNAKKPK